eukprot:COSAG02_NODE_3815_length_6192_cov_2.112260_10_plen_51_part_00
MCEAMLRRSEEGSQSLFGAASRAHTLCVDKFIVTPPAVFSRVYPPALAPR